MAAVRCKECAFVSKKNDGFCPECGAMYVEPLDLVDESLAGKAPARVAPKTEKKKGGGLFSFFGGSAREEREPAIRPAAQQVQKSSKLPEGVPREQIKIRCQECQHLEGIDSHQGYCDSCGAFYVEPFDYVTPTSLAEELQANQAELEKYKKVQKTYEEMSEPEKLAHLKEQVQDIFDQIVKDRYVLNEKANECMQCFTAAGTINSEDQFEVLTSMIKQRHHNLKDFEILQREYLQLLKDFSGLHEKLEQARQACAEQERRMKQAQAAG